MVTKILGLMLAATGVLLVMVLGAVLAVAGLLWALG